jgi:ABC-2 type transport system ATP-binding protein
MNSIETKHLYAKIGDFTLNDINLAIPEGSIVGLVGKNGAGKTTLFKTLNGTYLKTSGEMHIGGMNYRNAEKEIRMAMAVMYDRFGGNHYIKGKLLRKIYLQSHPKFDVEMFDDLVHKYGIDLKKKLMNLSFGMQKKLMLILALSLHPKILLLDEPLIGIDPIDKQEFIRLMQNYMENDQHTIILSSHQVDDLQKIADYILFINEGEIVLFEEKETLLEKYKMLTLPKEDQRVELMINPIPNSLGMQGLIHARDGKELKDKVKRPSLEQIFIHLCR